MSEQKQDGGPAFPVTFEHNEATSEQQGMSMLDYFAAKALPPCMYVCVNDTLEGGETRAELFARKAYEVANAMLKAREA